MSSYLKCLSLTKLNSALWRVPMRKLASESGSNQSKPVIALSSDGSTVLCWHPEPTFLYEHTKPLPRNRSELVEGASPLKVQHLMQESKKHSKNGPTRKELQSIFYTTKHQWFPKPRKRFAKDKPPKDREGI